MIFSGTDNKQTMFAPDNYVSDHVNDVIASFKNDSNRRDSVASWCALLSSGSFALSGSHIRQILEKFGTDSCRVEAFGACMKCAPSQPFSWAELRSIVALFRDDSYRTDCVRTFVDGCSAAGNRGRLHMF